MFSLGFPTIPQFCEYLKYVCIYKKILNHVHRKIIETSLFNIFLEIPRLWNFETNIQRYAMINASERFMHESGLNQS